MRNVKPDCAWNLVNKLDNQLILLTGKSAKELNIEYKLNGNK